MSIKNIVKGILFLASAFSGIIAIVDLVFNKNYLMLTNNIWQLLGLALGLFLVANIEKIQTFTLKIGEGKEVSIKLYDQEAQASIEYKKTKDVNEILYYYTKNIPLKIWDIDGVKHEAVDDLIKLLAKDQTQNDKIINSIRNLCILLDNFRIKSLENYGTNSNGTFINFNDGEVSCTGIFETSTAPRQVRNVEFPAAFSNIPAVNIIDKDSYININNISKYGFTITLEWENILARKYNYIAHG
jgi:hypothetical protein